MISVPTRATLTPLLLLLVSACSEPSNEAVNEQTEAPATTTNRTAAVELAAPPMSKTKPAKAPPTATASATEAVAPSPPATTPPVQETAAEVVEIINLRAFPEAPADDERPNLEPADGIRLWAWDELIPAHYRPGQTNNLADDEVDNDVRSERNVDELLAYGKQAPIRPELDGEEVRLRGFAVPIAADEEDANDFLLVPYHAATNDDTPAPSNQTVYVIAETGEGSIPARGEVVTVTGTLKLDPRDDLGMTTVYTLFARDLAGQD